MVEHTDQQFITAVESGLLSGRDLKDIADDFDMDVSTASVKVRKLGYDIEWTKTGKLIPIERPKLRGADHAA